MVTAQNLITDLTCKMCLKGCGQQNWCVTTHFHTFGPNMRSIDRGGGSIGKICSLEVQLFQNHSHMSYKKKAIVADA